MINRQTIRPEYWLYLFILIHVTVWTLVPLMVRFTLPMDAMEGATWGHQFEWGYDKNPFLNGWLTGLAYQWGGTSGWLIYFLSQASVAVCFWAIWQLGKKILPPLYALLAVLLLEGIQYYNVHAIDFNDNTLELGLWALTALFFYQALLYQKSRDWLLLGIFAGLGMMAKYYTALLLLPMMLFLIINPNNRATLLKPRTYWGLFAFLVIITPHVIWLFFHDFVTVSYAINRVSSPPTWVNHIHNAGLFAWQQFETLIPTLLILPLLFIGKKPLTQTPRLSINSFDKQFLFYVGLGPLLLTIILSACTGIVLRAAWGQPLLSLSGILLIAWLQPRITVPRFYRFVTVLYILLAMTLVGYSVALMRATAPSSANFPGSVIAKTLTTEWHDTYHKPLTYVAGARWFAGNVAFYSSDHPAVYINWDKKVSPWIKENELNTHGAIFVWDLTEGEDKTPAEIKARFNRLKPLRIMHFAWLRNKNMKPVEIVVAFLPPLQS